MKFTIKGGITLKVKRKCNMAQITVKDTGLGIKEEDIPKLFNEFCTLSEHQALNPNGTGLGLYLCKKFAKLMDGSISIKSTYGVGTKFTLKLPLAGGERTEEVKKNTIKKRETSEPKVTDIENFTTRAFLTASTLRTVLIVDDSPTNLLVVSHMVRKYGAETEKAYNGQQALDMIRNRGFSNPYSLVFMDVNMPIMSGVEVKLLIRIGGHYT
jgi:two-component system autoinducer 2 sensor kinase/phosphatase LuxQ